MPHDRQTGLVRGIGRWSLAALVINVTIGGAIFGLPSIIARLVGVASPLAYLAGAAVMGIIMGCFAEVASRFSQAGGPYLYARVAFGPFTGIQIGWISWLARMSAVGANANLFVAYLAEFWPGAEGTIGRLFTLTALIGIPAALNYRGVRNGAQFSNVFTWAKLSALFLFILAGSLYLFTGHGLHIQAAPHPGRRDWLDAMFLLVFVYGGFESALMPASEVKDPRRDTPMALLVALVTCTTLYGLVQWIVIHTLPLNAAYARPLAASASIFMGKPGAVLLTAGALISLYGWFGGLILASPRLTFALAEQGDFPAVFAAVHPRFRTPHISILVFAVASWILAVAGTYRWNIALSVIARLIYYGVVCAALPVLRRKQPGGAAFNLPFGGAWGVAGIAVCLGLSAGIGVWELAVLAIIEVIAIGTWLWARRRRPMLQPDEVGNVH